MKTSVTRIEPLFVFGFGGSTRIYYDDIISADVGDYWYDEDVDQCPNARERWGTEVKVIYKDENGVLLRYRDSIDRWNCETNVQCDEDIELIWVEKHPESTPCKNQVGKSNE